jgi:DNA-binding MarR family transcriptional regulator
VLKAVRTDSASAADACPSARDAQVLERWFAVFGGLHRAGEALLAEVESGLGVAQSEFRVLWHLVNAPRQAAPMNELSRLLGFSTAGTTKLMDRLVEAGLAERRAGAADRRVILAVLTDAGRDLTVRAAQALAEAVRRRVLEPLGEERFAALAEAVGMLDPGGGDGSCPPEAAPRPPC